MTRMNTIFTANKRSSLLTFYILECGTFRGGLAVINYTLLYSTLLQSSVQYCSLLYSTFLSSVVLPSTVAHHRARVGGVGPLSPVYLDTTVTGPVTLQPLLGKRQTL